MTAHGIIIVPVPNTGSASNNAIPTASPIGLLMPITRNPIISSAIVINIKITVDFKYL